MKLISIIGIGLAGVLALAAYGQTGQATKGGHAQENVVDASGNLRVPADYRTRYQFLGTWAIAADAGQGAKEMHNVYASPGTIAAYEDSGHFPDGAVLVKEVFATATAPMTTGTVSHVETLKGWFVMVKDSKNSHPGNALWGNGWGWSWLSCAQEPAPTLGCRASCLDDAHCSRHASRSSLLEDTHEPGARCRTEHFNFATFPLKRQMTEEKIIYEGDCGDGPGCRNGRDETGGSA
jgi:hypothetical protein